MKAQKDVIAKQISLIINILLPGQIYFFSTNRFIYFWSVLEEQNHNKVQVFITVQYSSLHKSFSLIFVHFHPMEYISVFSLIFSHFLTIFALS